MDSSLNAVMHLHVQLGKSIVVVHRSITNIAKGRGVNHISTNMSSSINGNSVKLNTKYVPILFQQKHTPHNKSGDGLILGDGLRGGRASNVTKKRQ